MRPLSERLSSVPWSVYMPKMTRSPGAKHAVLHGKMQKLYRAQRAITLGAGTSEIQRNIIARRGLGMGR